MRTCTSSATFEKTLAEGWRGRWRLPAPPRLAERPDRRGPGPGASRPARCRHSRGARGRHDLRQRLDAVRIVEEAQDAVDLEAAGRHADVPFELRSRQLSRDLQRGPDPDVTKLVVDDLEVLRLEREVHGADLSFVHRELAGDGELLAVLVEDLETPDAHDVGLEIDAGVEAGVRRAQSRHRERAVPDLEESDDVRIAAGPGDPHVSLERAPDLRDGGRESLNDAEIQRRRLQPDVDGVLRRAGDVPARRGLEHGRRHRPAGGDRDAGRLLQRRVERDPVARVPTSAMSD